MRREKYDFKFEAGKLPSSRFPLLTASASVLRIHHQLFITIDKTIHKVLGHLKAESTIVQVFLMQSYVENVFLFWFFFAGISHKRFFFLIPRLESRTSRHQNVPHIYHRRMFS